MGWRGVGPSPAPRDSRGFTGLVLPGDCRRLLPRDVPPVPACPPSVGRTARSCAARTKILPPRHLCSAHARRGRAHERATNDHFPAPGLGRRSREGLAPWRPAGERHGARAVHAAVARSAPLPRQQAGAARAARRIDRPHHAAHAMPGGRTAPPCPAVHAASHPGRLFAGEPPPARHPPPARPPQLQPRAAREAVRREGGWRRAKPFGDRPAREAYRCRPAPVLRRHAPRRAPRRLRVAASPTACRAGRA